MFRAPTATLAEEKSNPSLHNLRGLRAALSENVFETAARRPDERAVRFNALSDPAKFFHRSEIFRQCAAVAE